jgi:hypothetical protein
LKFLLRDDEARAPKQPETAEQQRLVTASKH